MKYSEYSVVIVGSGAAGLYAALKISQQINLPEGVLLLTKSYLGNSNSLYAQGLSLIHIFTDLCGVNLPELTEMNAVIKYSVLQAIEGVNSKLEAQDASVQNELNNLKTDIITQFLNIFNQISFVAEQEEMCIRDSYKYKLRRTFF